MPVTATSRVVGQLASRLSAARRDTSAAIPALLRPQRSTAPTGLAPVRISIRHASSGTATKLTSSATEKPKAARPLQTYNVTKADARPVLSEHHKLSWDDKRVLVPWEEGKTSHFHNIWLRDHCQCGSCQHPETKQRLLDTFKIPDNICAESVESDGKGLKIIWKHDKHESFFPFEWLHLHSYNPRLQRYLSSQYTMWGSGIKDDPPAISYEEVIASDEGVAAWTRKIHNYGFCFVDGVPVTPEDTKTLVERIAFIRPTHYGGFWDFTADLAKKDTAYTDLPLGAHTDTTYFSDPAGLQLFHLLSHEGDGGASLLVDGFKAARILRDEFPESYRTLSNTRIPTHASGNTDSSVQPYAPFPVLNHHPVNGALVQVRWNNDDRGTMDRWDEPEDVEKFYQAIRDWNNILTRKDLEYWEQLKPGRALIFDNWRVLHGRAGFTGIRRMCGAYVNRDDYISRYVMTNTSREDVLKAI